MRICSRARHLDRYKLLHLNINKAADQFHAHASLTRVTEKLEQLLNAAY